MSNLCITNDNKSIEIVENSLISVVIPAFNRGHCIQRTISSCINQSYKNIEIIVCDDSSTDNTVAIVNELCKVDNRIKLVANKNGKGAQAAREQAICVARGEYIVFLDSDDILLEDSIRERYKTFLCDRSIDMVYGDVLLEKAKGVFDCVKYDSVNDMTDNEIKRYLCEELSLCAYITIMVKASVFGSGIVRLDKRLPAWQDDSLVLSLVFSGLKIYHCGRAVAAICTNGDNISTHYKNKYLGLKALLEQYSEEIYSTCGLGRICLWKMRLLLDYMGVKMQETDNKFFVMQYKIAFMILEKILKKFFRHIYG